MKYSLARRSLPAGAWLLVAVAACCVATPSAADSGAVMEIDLASDTAWTLAHDGGAPRPIKVTAGGWNSDQQEPQIPSDAVKDHVFYARQITIPAEAKGRA